MHPEVTSQEPGRCPKSVFPSFGRFLHWRRASVGSSRERDAPR
jgi:hypothetical protein